MCKFAHMIRYTVLSQTFHFCCFSPMAYLLRLWNWVQFSFNNRFGLPPNLWWRDTKSSINIRRTAMWYIAPFPSHVCIRCIAPGSYWIWIRIAAIVPCCRSTSVRIVCIILCSWTRYMRCIGCPRLTCSFIHSRAQSSHVLTPEFSLSTIWTK